MSENSASEKDAPSSQKSSVGGAQSAKQPGPGKQTRTSRLVSSGQATASDANAAPTGAGSDDPVSRALAGQGTAVPFRPQMESMFGESFSDVAAHVGKEAELSGVNANAAARSDQVAFATSSPSPSLVAHELTHVVQQRQAGTDSVAASRDVADETDAAEVEADQIAQHVADHGMNAGTVNVSAVPTARTHLDRKRSRPQAVLYFDFHKTAVMEYLLSSLAEMPLPLPSQFATWGRGHARFWLEFTRRLIYFSNSVQETIRTCLRPTPLEPIINRGRSISDDGTADQGVDDVGPGKFNGTVGMELVRALLPRVVASLARVLPRYLAARSQATTEQTVDGVAPSPPPEPDPQSMLVSRQIDKIVINALTQRGIVNFNVELYQKSNPAPVMEELARPVRYDFAPDAGHNWIRVISPADARAEDVALTLFGDPAEAQRLTAVPPMFAMSPEDFKAMSRDKRQDKYRVSKARKPDEVDIPFGGEADPSLLLGFLPIDVDGWDSRPKAVQDREQKPGRDDAAALANTSIGDDLGQKQAGPIDGKVSRAVTLNAIQQSLLKLTVASATAEFFGMSGALAPVRVKLTQRQRDLSFSPMEDVEQWQAHAIEQSAILLQVTTGLQSIQRHLTAMRVKKMKDLPPNVLVPLYGAAEEFVGAAAASNLLDTGRARVATAKRKALLAPIDTLDIMLEGVLQRSHQLKQVDKSNLPPGRGKESRTGLVDDHFTLKQRVGEMRARLLAGDMSVFEELPELQANVERVQQGTDIALVYGATQELSKIFRKLQNDWTTLSLQKSDAHAFMIDSHIWENHWEHAWSAWQEGDVDSVRDRMARFLAPDQYPAFLKRAHAEIKDINLKTMIVQIAATIGIIILSMGVGTAAGGLATGLRGGVIGEFVASTVAESLTASLMNAWLFEQDDAAQALVDDFGSNLMMLGALNSFSAMFKALPTLKRLEATGKRMKVGERMEAGLAKGATSGEKILGYTFKGAEVTGRAAVTAGVMYLDAQAKKIRESGRAMTDEEVSETAKKGIAVFIATVILKRVLKSNLKAIWGKSALTGARLNKYARVRRLAKQARDTGDPEMAKAALRADRKMMQLELENFNKRIAKEGLSQEDATALEAEANEVRLAYAVADLPLSLDEVALGSHFAGTKAQLAESLTSLTKAGAEVTAHRSDGGGWEYQIKTQKGSPDVWLMEKQGTRENSPDGAKTPQEAQANRDYAEHARTAFRLQTAHYRATVDSMAVVEVARLQIGGNIAAVINEATKIGGKGGGGKLDSLTLTDNIEASMTAAGVRLGQKPDAISGQGMQPNNYTAKKGEYTPAGAVRDAVDVSRYESGMAVYEGRADGAIERKGTDSAGDAPWQSSKALRVWVGGAGSGRYFYADHIEVTVGVGKAKLAPAEWFGGDTDIRKQLTDAGLLIYTDSLREQIKRGAGRVLVIGGGPSGSWASESVAEVTGNVTFRARVGKATADKLAAAKRKHEASPDDWDLELEYKEMYDAAKVEAFASARLDRNTQAGAGLNRSDVDLQVGMPDKMVRDGDKVRVLVDGAWEVYDQVVVTIGGDPRRPGGAAKLTEDVPLQIMRDGDGEAIALESKEGDVTVKGASFAEPKMRDNVIPRDQDTFVSSIKRRAAKFGSDSKGVTHGMEMAHETIPLTNQVSAARRLGRAHPSPPIRLSADESFTVWQEQIQGFFALEAGVPLEQITVIKLGSMGERVPAFVVMLGKADIGTYRVIQAGPMAPPRLYVVR